MSVWLDNYAGKNVVSKWYSSDEYVSNGFWSFRAEQLIAKFENQVWIAYHESGSYYDTPLEEYTKNYREEQIRKHISLN